jgi:hypothetical protein
MEFTQYQRENPRAASSTVGMINRRNHEDLGQITMYSKSRK